MAAASIRQGILKELIELFSNKSLLENGKKKPSIPLNFINNLYKCDLNLTGSILDLVTKLELNGNVERRIRDQIGKSLVNLINNEKDLKMAVGELEYSQWVSRQLEYKYENSKFLLSNLKNPARWIGWVIIKDNILFGTPKSTSALGNCIHVSDNEASSYLHWLLRTKNQNDCCQLLDYSQRFDLIDFKTLLSNLTKNNDVTNLLLVLGEQDRRLAYIKDYENKCKLIFQHYISSHEMKMLSLYGKTCRKLIMAWKMDSVDFPYIMLANTLGHLNFVFRTVQSTLGSFGNPNYNTNEIATGLIDIVVDMVAKIPTETRQVLSNLICQKLSALKLMQYQDYIFANRIEESTQNLPILSSDYYTASAPIYNLHQEGIPKLMDKITLGVVVGIDCEWTNSDLALIQLCFRFPTETETYLIDPLALSGSVLKPLMELIFANCTIIVFDGSQDVSKIKNHCSIVEAHNVITVDLQPKGESLETLVNKELGLKFDKRPRMTLWERRPLLRCQALYAAGDAQVLVDIYSKTMMKKTQL